MQPPRLKAGGRAFAHIAQYHPELTALRRDLHAHPELGFEEVYTSNRVKEALRLCGVDAIHDGIGRTGVVAVIRGRSQSSGAMVGLRADMDALPITETVFQWPGIGLLFIQAVTFADIPVMAAYLCLIALIFVVINLVVDLLYFVVDPRLRVGQAGGH